MDDGTSEEPNSKFILISLAVIFAWMLLGNLMSLAVGKSDFKHIRARVIDLRKKQYKCSGGFRSMALCEKLELKVQGFKSYYVIADYANPEIGVYVLDINKGDTIDIYVKKWYQWLLNFGRFHQIEYLEKDGSVYYYNTNHQIYWIAFGTLGLIIFLPLLYIEMNTKKLLAEGKLD
jgi:hypothetical protein